MNILLVDDKYDVVQGIAQGVDWDSIGDIRLFFAYSGEEALDIIERNKIQLLVTDIEMPGMSGLELVAALKKQRQEIGVIFLTSYDSFRYAQSAIRLGCFDYILQPVEYEKLQNSIIHVINLILTQRIEKDCSGGAEQEKNAAIHRDGAWKEVVLHTPAYSEKVMRDILEEVQVYPPTGREYRMVLATLFRSKESLDSWIAHRKEKTFLESLRQALAPSLQVAAGFSVSSQSYLLIVENGDVVSSLRNFEEKRAAEDSGVMAVYVSDPAPFSELPGVYRRLQRLNSDNVGRYGGVFAYSEAVGNLQMQNMVSSHLAVQEWKNWLLEGQENRIREDVARFVRIKDEAKELDKRSLVIIVQLIISSLYRFESKDMEKLMADNGSMESFVHATDSAADLLAFLDEVLACYRKKAENQRSDSNGELLLRVKSYVDSHIAEPLSRDEIANKFFVSKDYLSHLFARNEGMGFTQYVNEQRMAKAKELLRSTTLPIKIIALNVGITDYAYFSRMFRKSEGISANEYRAKFRG